VSGAVQGRLRLIDGSTSFISGAAGDVEAKTAEGFFHEDMRHLSRWQLRVDDEQVDVLASQAVDYYSGRIYGAVGDGAGDEQPRLSIRRDRFVADGVHEDLLLENHSGEPRTVRIELRIACDFGDILECRKTPHKRGRMWSEDEDGRLTLHYERDGFHRATIVRTSEPSRAQHDRLMLEPTVPARGTWHTCIDIIPVVGGEERPSRYGCDHFGQAEPLMPLSLEEWVGSAPRLETTWDGLRHVYDRSLVDLASLRFRPDRSSGRSLLAAGLPWFMTLFGRDSMIAGFQVLPYHPHVARTALEALAGLQAREHDEFRDAEPGKILHELRRGELAALGDLPHSPYYGAHDTTPLFLVLLDEYARWTGDEALVRELEGAARRAITWVETHGDPDGDGYLEYSKRSPLGLDNQCWKDSGLSMAYANGTLAPSPIAVCEVQGYAYDARRRAARLARSVWGDEALADRLERDAAALKDRFNRDYWLEERGHFALALDRDKRPVDALTSNVGHLLWSGIVDEARAEAVVSRLLADDMWTGWGIRTMSSDDGAYNPIEYHNGTVWPFDTAIAAEGMRRYGFRDQASRVARGLLEAAAAFGGRLPEVFAGFGRRESRIPVEYPGANEPQAFASGAPLMALRTLLGLDAVDGSLRTEPHLPDGLELRLDGVHVGNEHRRDG